MKFKLPESIKDYRIKHLVVLDDERLAEPYPSLDLKIDVISKVSGVMKALIYQVHIPDIDQMFSKIIGDLSQIKTDGKPLDEIVIDGTTYILINPEKAPAGWHADCAKSDFIKDPVRLACICYIPKGTFYGQLDQHSNVIHPIRERYELFENEFPLEAFIKLHAFFLQKFERLMKISTAKLRTEQRNQKIRKLIDGFGRSSLIRFLSTIKLRGTKQRK